MEGDEVGKATEVMIELGTRKLSKKKNKGNGYRLHHAQVTYAIFL